MSLLPPNATKELRATDTVLGARIEALKELDLDLNPLTCKKEILPHLAFIYSLDISNLSVDEQRQYIHNAFEIRTHQGTLYSVKKALKLIFNEATIKEWFNYAGEPYHFKADLILSADVSKIYDEAKFKKTNFLLNLAKNTRSVFDGFELSLPNAKGNINLMGGGVFDVHIQNELDFNTGANFKLYGGVVWTV
ncbi:phage tail protein I [Sulfurimonas sp.]|uniref:phage tail protein I n=1 Tax=Sulfurimonas sp. TaxID=2022749 RepID=UPI002B4974EA|nr:phage tail protein I [Sulfurimonas sp.]